jgi:hypothetical protein
VIRIQGFDDQKWKKNLQLKKILLGGSKTAIYLSLGLHKDVQKKPSALKREHSALQNMIFLIFFLLLWVTFALLDPDLLTRLNPDPIRIRIRNPVLESVKAV